MTGRIETGVIDPLLEEQYNARAAVPEHGSIFTQWRERSEAFRARTDCLLDIPYGEGERERLDLFPSRGERLHLFLHGGYWQAMDKAFFSFLAQQLVSQGRDVAICNYPLAPEADLSRILDSVRRACRFLYLNSDRYDACWESLQVSGHSAGGQLVGMLLATDWPGLDPELPMGLIDSGVSISGLYDLEPLLKTSINVKLRLDPDAARRNSPLHLDPVHLAPMLLVTGAEERTAFQHQMETFARNRRGFGVPVETLSLPGLNHFTVVQELARAGSDLLLSTLRL